jgi:hypothetical protein
MTSRLSAVLWSRIVQLFENSLQFDSDDRRAVTGQREPTQVRLDLAPSLPKEGDGRQPIENAQSGWQHGHGPLAQGESMERVEQLQQPITDEDPPERLSPVRKPQRHDGKTQEDATATDHQDQRPFGFSDLCASHFVQEPRHRQSSQLEPSKNGKAQRNMGSDGHVGIF